MANRRIKSSRRYGRLDDELDEFWRYEDCRSRTSRKVRGLFNRTPAVGF